MLHLSHSLDSLVDLLTTNLLGSPFQKRWIVLPSRLNQQWLMASLSKRVDGGWMGLEILTWREALMRLSSRIPNEFELRLGLAECLARKELPPSFKPLTEWMGQGKGREAKLARTLSRGLNQAGFYGLDSAKEWQSDLVRMLSKDGLWRFPDQLIDSAEVSVEMHLFCIDEMPKKAWDFFARSGALIYHFSPCSLYWDDLCSDRERRSLVRKWRGASNVEEFESYLKDSHPLLANWGKIGRQTIRHLEELPSQEAYEFEPGNKRLHRLQQELLELQTETGDALADDSIELIAAGSSRLRELQILRDRLLAYFKQSGADPAEVLVLAPDIKPYAPLIQFVFGDEMPYSIAPIDGFRSNLLAQGLCLFFDLAGGSWDADRILELFESGPFRKKQNLSAEDLELFRGWMKDARVRSGWESWSDGLKRMVLALACLSPDEEVRGLDLGQAERLERLLEMIEKLRLFFDLFRSQEKRSLEEWGGKLNELVKELFLPEEKEKELFISFLRKIFSAAKKFPETLFSWELLHSLFVDFCKSDAQSYQPNLWQAVQFSSLQPGSIRPAKAIFLLGMENDAFPRKRSSGSFDWAASAPDPADSDRYLLLQAIFAAKERLSISYCHISPDDGKPVELSLPLQELKLAPLPVNSLSLQEEKPSCFWPEKPLAERKKILDLKDLAALAKNPWKFFLQKTVGIYLHEEPLFSELRCQEFELPVYTKRELLFDSLSRPIEDLLKEKRHLLPPGVFGEGAQARLEFESNEWKEKLAGWKIDPKEIHSIHFSPRCKTSRTLKEGWIEAPALRVGEIEIRGDLPGVAPSGLLLQSGGTNRSLAVRHWPLLLVHLLHFGQNKGALYSFQGSAKGAVFEIDAKAALERWIAYFFRAQESLSPLITPWIDSFLKDDFHEWSQKADEALAQEKDRWIGWVALRADPIPCQKIWEEWSAFTRETFAELIDADV